MLKVVRSDYSNIAHFSLSYRHDGNMETMFRLYLDTLDELTNRWVFGPGPLIKNRGEFAMTVRYSLRRPVVMRSTERFRRLGLAERGCYLGTSNIFISFILMIDDDDDLMMMMMMMI